MHQKQIAALLIEDNPGDVLLARTMLSDCRGIACRVEWADCLDAGLQRLAKGGIDIVLLDLQLPDSAGLDTLRRLRSATPQGLVVVILSGHWDEETGVRAIQEGAQDYLIKGRFDGDLLLRSIRYAMERQESEQALREARADLERQVQERTSKLAVAVQCLESENAERKRAEEALIRLNRELRAISNCNQTLLRASDEQTLLDQVCQIVCESAGYRMAWVGYAQHDEAKSVRPVAWAGVEEGYLATANITWADTERGRGPTGTAIRSGVSTCIQDFATDAQAALWRQHALERGYRSTIALPLKGDRGTAFGVMTIYSTDPHAFTPDEVRMLEELAGDLAFGITTLRMRQQHDRAEAALRASEEKYRRIVDTANEGIWVLGPDTLTTSVNARMAQMLGYSAEEVLGRSLTAFMFEEDIADHLQKMEDRRQGISECYERRFRRKDGQPLWTLASAAPIFDNEHRFQGSFAMLTDITQRKQAEDELRSAHQQLQRSLVFRDAMLSSIPTPVFYKDLDGRYLGCNHAFAEMMGVTSEQIKGKTVHELWPGPHAEVYHRKDLELLAHPARQIYEHALQDKDGAVHQVIFAKNVFRDENGQVAGIIGAFADITERKQAEAALQEAKDAADEANRAKDQFLAVLSHELRTPLTPVLATVSALETQGELPAEIREDLDLIRRNVALETKLIDDLLDFTRLARGKLQLHYEVVDAHACLEAALQVCQGQIQEKRLNVLMHLEAQQHQVWADPARLQQVFWNLLQNAAKFTPEHGAIHLQSCNLDGRLQLQVRDSGIGIEPAMLPRLFDAFVQAEQTKARRFGGLGMGLTIAKNIMDLHKGQLMASSAGPNQGATFTVELAVFAAQPTVADPPPAALPKPQQGRHILLVEDTPDTLKVLTRLLTRWGHQVTPADSVHAALEYAAKERFDLLVSDIGLPDGSGLDIMRQVKQAYDLPGIAVSGYGMEEDLKQSQEAGFTRHLTKPVSFEALQAAVREAVPT